MEYFLNELQETVKQMARTIAEEKILPVRAQLDEKEEFPRAIMKDLADTDLLGVYIPEEYGGLGGGCFEMCLVTEELGRVCAGVAVSYAANSLGSYALLEYGSDEQKQKYLPGIARGKMLAAFALTEESAGSDASAVKTTATRTDKGYMLNGTKLFITNGGEADIYTVIALTDRERGVRGASAFLVEKDIPGFSFGRKEKKLGIRTSATRELVFEDCLVPTENIIGREGAGFPMIMRLFDRSRPIIGAQAVGIALGALEAALDHARNRIQFEHPIIFFQAVQHMLANMATDIEAARALVYGAARTIDSGAKDFSMESAMAKVFASDVAMRVTTDAVQIFGGVGYMRDYPVEKMMRDAKITQIYEGTNQILRNVIASELRKKKTL
ncbi:MAG: acyl-CoA dehydrogenase family protein [Dehalococcoidales bacterium]|nr:acyl-CoA dehydrogenase family protein [Dehalococcoidales bacterium]